MAPKFKPIPKLLVAGVTLLTVVAPSWGQQCPDWSPKFSQINDSIALQQLQSLRSQGWPNLNPQTNGGVSLQQGIQGLEETIQQYQQAMQQNEQIWMRVRGGNGQMPNLTSDQCRSMTSASAATAAACEVVNDRNAILAAEGTEDLARCRAGLPQGSYASPGSLGMGTSGDPGSAYERGAEAAAAGNISKRADMVKSVVKGWQPPVEQQTAQGSLAERTPLADPFANPVGVGSGSAVNSATEMSAGDVSGSSGANQMAAVSDSDKNAEGSTASDASTTAGSGWTDPLTDPSASPDAGLAPNPSPQEIAGALDAGISNSHETSATPVATVANSGSWDAFSSASPTGFDPSSSNVLPGGATTSTPDAADGQIDLAMENANTIRETLGTEVGEGQTFLPTNEASEALTEQGIDAVGAVAHQLNHTVNDLDSALQSGHATPEQINADLEALPSTLQDSLVPDTVRNIQEDLDRFQNGVNYVTKQVHSASCLFFYTSSCQ